MERKQRTIRTSQSCQGVGLHTGVKTAITFHPAPENSGIRFIRSDIKDCTEIKADIDHVVDISRGTTIEENDVRIHTVEHALAAVSGLRLDNILIELTGKEPPVMDGSAKDFVECLIKAGIRVQNKERKVLEITRAVNYTNSYRDIDIHVIPSDRFRITFMVEYNLSALGTQYEAIYNMEEDFAFEVAPARTFCFLSEVEMLKERGLIKGGGLDNAVVIIDTSYDTIDLEIKSLFIEGNYNKYDRTVPQTRWPCSSCKGYGCKKCKDTGQLYPDSVQSLVAESFIKASLCKEDLFHGMGREDIDAAMLGSGRPFVIELRMPKKRELNLEAIGKEINFLNESRIRVTNLKFVDRPRVAELKNTVCDKTYRVDVSVKSEDSIESLKKGSQRLTGTVIEQRTPTRVSHRRADLVRPRLINSVDVVSFEDNMVELVIRAQHGTYIRELVSGDKGRTVPSLSSLIDASCKVEVLDVLNLHLEAKEEKND